MARPRGKKTCSDRARYHTGQCEFWRLDGSNFRQCSAAWRERHNGCGWFCSFPADRFRFECGAQCRGKQLLAEQFAAEQSPIEWCGTESRRLESFAECFCAGRFADSARTTPCRADDSAGR